ncbi:MAG: FkbM family methyltransferase [Bryobacteraceae bacterium]
MTATDDFKRKLRRVLSEPQPLRFACSRVLWATGACRMLDIPRCGYRLRFYPTALSASLWHQPDSFTEDERLLRAILRPGDTFVDVGANIGSLTMCASAAVGSAGSVFAFEPHPRTFHFLRGNMRWNRARNVQAFNLACGDGAMPAARLSSRRSDDQNAICPESEGVSVSAGTLDAVLGSATSVSLLKIDVEGYELFVLRGASASLLRTKAILFESWQSHFRRYGYGLADVASFLSELGFTIYSVYGDTLRPLVPGYQSECCENLLAVRDLEWFLGRTAMSIAS